MMELYLLRHADAEPPLTSDSIRQLTEQGHEEADRVARFCQAHGLSPELILTSPYVRAEQTARAVAGRLGVELLVTPFLSSGTPCGVMLEALGGYQRFERLMVVGHEPDLSLLAGRLIGVEGGLGVRVKKASLLRLRLPAVEPGLGVLDFSIPVKLM